MRRRMRASSALLSVLALLFGLPIAASASVPHKDWDQEVVTQLARELYQAAGDLLETVRHTPAVGDATLNPQRSQRRLRQEALDDMRIIQFSIRSLVERLEQGEGRLETYPTFNRIRRLRNRIARAARLATLQEATLSKLAAARAALEKLEPYYAPEEAH